MPLHVFLSGGCVGFVWSEYKGFVLPVYRFCTPSTWLLYCEYKGFVLTSVRFPVAVARLRWL